MDLATQNRETVTTGVDGARPDYALFDGIKERDRGIVRSVVDLFRERSERVFIAVAALLCLCYIARAVLNAGDKLTTSSLIGTLVITLLISAIGVITPLKHAEDPKKNAKYTTQPRNERTGAPSLGATPGPDSS